MCAAPSALVLLFHLKFLFILAVQEPQLGDTA
jgi:hypothetical protein